MKKVLMSGPVLVAFTLLVLMAIWYTFLEITQVPSFILPAPHRIIETFVSDLVGGFDNRSGLWYHGVTTLSEAGLGYMIGVTSGIVMAILMTEVSPLERALTPYVMALQSLPKLALAPLFVIWFGFGMTSKVLVVILMVFFPLLINTLEGLKGVDPDQRDLLRLLKASRLTMLWKLKLPFALPHIFSGLRLAITLSLLGAIVGEFVGGRRGLGVLLVQRQGVANVRGVFSIFVALSAIAAACFAVLVLIERRALFWARRAEADR